MNRQRLRVGLIAAVALLLQAAFVGPIAAQDATPAAGDEAVEEAEPSLEMLDIPGMRDELRRPMMLLVRARAMH